MFAFGIIELLFLLLVLLVIPVVLVLTTRSLRASVPRGPEERRVVWVRLSGIVLGLLAAIWPIVEPVPLSPGLGIELVLAPMLFGLVVLVAVVVGEVVVRPRFETAERFADLRPRRIRDHLPPVLTPLVAAVSVGAVALCSVTVFTAAADDLGRAGRALSATCPDGSFSTRSPYPGSFYVTAYAIGVVLAILLAALAARQITQRSLGGTPEQADRHRTVGMRAIVGALGVVVAAPLAGLALFAGVALTGHECVPSGFAWVGGAALLLALLAAVTALTSLLSLLIPLPSAARDREDVRA